MPQAFELVTAERLKAICPRIRSDILEAILTEAPTAFPKAGLVDTIPLAHFIAQIATEAAGLSRLDENLYYTTAAVLQRTFKSKFATIDDAKPYLRKPRELANFVYAESNGNKGGDDGWTYRGSGLIQLTGREIFEKIGDFVGMELEQDPELARQPDSALAIALGFWGKKDINSVATNATEEAVTAVTKRINPALRGLSDRKKFFKTALKVLTSKASQVEPASRPRASERGVGFGLAALPAAPASGPELSGASWIVRYPTSREISDLAKPFRDGVAGFLAALQAAGATVRISATWRPPQRAYLMHWAWLIAKGQVDPASVPPMPGVDIIWTHASPTKSRAAAKAMVDGYGMVHVAALNSRHTEHRAIDMTIGWSGAISLDRKDGTASVIASQPRNGSNPAIIAVGATYGVVKLPTDPPHWSDDGR